MRSVGVIVARGGSKRIPRKVLRSLGGIPLLAWMSKAALASRLDAVVLSTDDAEIAALGRELGLSVPFLRPAELAQDFVRNDDVVLHAIDMLGSSDSPGADIAVLLQPTAPFTLPGDIDACLDAMEEAEIACCFTARKATERPEWMFVPGDKGTVKLLLGGELVGDRQHSQKLTTYYVPSGAVWATRADTLRRTRSFYAPPLRIVEVEEHRSADIDVEDDLIVAEALLRAHALAPVSADRGRGRR